VPFLRLTRDRRGHEHTFLMHQEGPGQKARVIYWYRTAPAVTMGRPPLDEEAIRTIEEQHPDIDFDWPAILALREVMTPEEEAKPERPQRRQRPQREPPAPRAAAPPAEPEELAVPPAEEPTDEEDAEAEPPEPPATTFGLLDQLVGREIATRLRARHAEVLSRIHTHRPDDPRMPVWIARADAMDPDTWLTAEAVLHGVQLADAMYDSLRRELQEAHP
jgi:hypothetical protein